MKVELTIDEIYRLLYATKQAAAKYPYGKRFVQLKASEKKLMKLINQYHMFTVCFILLSLKIIRYI